jgi:hypothetical protein
LPKVPGPSTKLHETHNNNGNEGRIYWDGQLVAHRSSEALTYFDHQDTLGTQRIRTNYGGSVASTYLSLPWGDGYSATVNNFGGDQDNEHFAGLERDAESDTEHAQFETSGEIPSVPEKGRHSNDSLKTISAIFPRDRTIRSQINDRIPFRTARADALPPVAAHSSARHEPQTTKIDLFVYMRVSLQDAADIIVQENIDHFCCIGHHQRVH